MTLQESFVQGLKQKGLDSELATRVVAAYRAKGMVNRALWDKEAQNMDVSTVLILWNSVNAMSLSSILRALRTENPDATTLIEFPWILKDR